MCNNPNLLPQVNRAKCATIALMIFGILSVFSFANLMNPWYWNEWALVFVIDGVGGILGIIASSTLICCGGAGINDQQAKASAACKHKGSMGCAIGAAVCFGAYVIAMVIALAQLAGCDDDVCRALMWPAAIGLILGLMCLASAIVAAVFAGKASTAIEAFNPDALPSTAGTASAVATAVATPSAVATAVATPAVASAVAVPAKA